MSSPVLGCCSTQHFQYGLSTLSNVEEMVHIMYIHHIDFTGKCKGEAFIKAHKYHGVFGNVAAGGKEWLRV